MRASERAREREREKARERREREGIVLMSHTSFLESTVVLVCAMMVIVVIVALFVCLLLMIELSFNRNILYANIAVLVVSLVPMCVQSEKFNVVETLTVQSLP